MNKIALALVFFILVFTSCNNDDEKGTDIPDVVDTTDVVTVIKNVYYSMPSPLEMATVIKRYATEFSPDSLHDTKVVSDYTTNQAKAVNLGIYASDLAFLSMYGQHQSSNSYFETIIKLADELDIVEGINDTMVNQIHTNLDNPQEIKEIIAEAFFKSDAYLKETNKEHVASLILAGAWVESVYILSNMLDNQNDTSDIYELFIDQRLILENVRKVTATILDKSFNKELDELQLLFDDCITITETQVMDDYTGEMRTKTNVEYDYNMDDVLKIRKKISKIRKNFVSLH